MPPKDRLTKHNETGMCVSGAQRILGRAAIHGAIELGWHSLQNQLFSLSLRAAVQQAAPHPRPGEEGFREHLILSTPRTQMRWRGLKKKRKKREGKKR